MENKVFDNVVRVDQTPRRENEERFTFWNRSASVYSGRVRSLIEDWFGHVERDHQPGLRGDLRSDDQRSAGAFWELYLHEGYRRSGYEVDIHPEVPGAQTRPDFRLRKHGYSFYLEAVSVGRRDTEVAERHRLAQFQSLLQAIEIEDFKLRMEVRSVGPTSTSTKRLRLDLQQWVAGLDPGDVGDRADRTPDGPRFDSLPTHTFAQEGWSLIFHAIPLAPWARHTLRPALAIAGGGGGYNVDHVAGLKRALDSKRSKYGVLDAPLVVAIQSNTEIPTQVDEIAHVLYGSTSHNLNRSEPTSGAIDGFWVADGGWRRSTVAQVITACGLTPFTVTQTVPQCWNTLQPGVAMPQQPDWIARTVLGERPAPAASTSLAEHFGLAADWPGVRPPDVDSI